MVTPKLPASRLVRVGLLMFLAGLVFIAVDVLPFFDGVHNQPLWLNLACLLAPAGFGLAIWGGLRAGRAEQRAAAREIRGGEIESMAH